MLTSHFWFQMTLVSAAILLLVWFTKTAIYKTTTHHHSEQAYPYVLTVLSLLLFIVILGIILVDHGFLGLNQKMFALSQSNFDEQYRTLVTAITLFGNFKVIFLTVLLTSLWFLYKKQWRTFIYWLGNIIFGYGITIVIKNITKIPRPPVVDPTDVASLYSFPSGHIVRVVLMLTFFNLLIAPFISRRQKNINFFIAGFLIIFMSLSRLFLDAHWLSDVVGSIALGLASAITVFTFYQRRDNPVLPVKTLALILSLSWLVSWAIIYLPHF